MIRLFVTVEEVNAVMDAGYTHIRVYTDTSSGGDFTTLDGTITLVASTESYEYTDIEGSSATWYKTCYYGAAVGQGNKSAARKGDTAAAYATVKELRAEMDKTSTADDVTLARLLDSAALSINRACNRPDGFMADPTASARIYAGSGKPYQRIDECTSITTVAVKDSVTDSSYTEWDDDDWIPFSGDPRAPNFNSTPYTAIMVDPTGDESVFTSGGYTTKAGFRPTTDVFRGVPTVQVTAKWGFSTEAPADIKEICIEQAARWYKHLQSAGSGTLATTELGQLKGQNLDADLESRLATRRYIRPALGRR